LREEEKRKSWAELPIERKGGVALAEGVPLSWISEGPYWVRGLFDGGRGRKKERSWNSAVEFLIGESDT